jgi:polyisoprenyl-teichoic acid--peptidoglycan teichoic acid transferase
LSRPVRTPQRSVPPRSTEAALILSFLWPGVGQRYLGRRRTALLYAVPAIVLALLLLWEARDGPELLLARVFIVPTATAVLVTLTVLLAIWRLASMTETIHAGPWRAARTSVPSVAPAVHAPRQRRTLTLFVVLALVVIITHGLIAWAGLEFLDASSHIFVTDGGGQGADVLPGSSPAGGPLPTPYASPAPGGRINVLLVGSDSGLGYSHSLTDSMIVVSVDPVTKSVDMVSFPRDIAEFPLYSGGTFSGKLNSLVTFAAAHSAQMPDGGLGTLTREIGFLLGIPIHYYAYVNLAQFKSVVDLAGGVNVDNLRAIADPGYEFPDGAVGFFLSAGPHHLDGRLALAYVRSRNGVGDNDFTRARRQQQVLIALRDRLTDPALLPRLPDLLQAMARTVQTDLPADQVPDLLQLAPTIPAANVAQFVLGPPYATTPTPPGGTYMLLINRQKFAALSIRLFGSESAYAATPGPTVTP